jgi:PAS domain S-box-containing protein
MTRPQAAGRSPSSDEPHGETAKGSTGPPRAVTAGLTSLQMSAEERLATGRYGPLAAYERDLLADIGLGAVALDPAGRVQFINDHLLATIGRTRDEILSSEWIEIAVVEPDRAAARTAFRESMSTGILPERRDYGILTPTGEERRLIWTSVIQRAPDGRVSGVVSIAHDVTEARRSETERALLAAAIEQSAESVVITDAQARITYVNSAFEQVSGYRGIEVIGKNPRILKSGVQSATFYDAMWAAIANGLPWVADMTNRRKDGELYHLTSVISPIRAADGAITGFVSVGRDVTHERELETRAELLTRERALITETLRRLPTGGTLEASAELFCRQVASLTDVATTALIIFEADGAAIPVAYVAADSGDVGRRPHNGPQSRHIREHANTGPWVEAWSGQRTHPYSESFRKAGVRAIAYAPVIYDGCVIAVLAVSSAEEDATTQLSGQLGAIVDFANIAGALLGRRLGDGREARRHRAVTEGIIAECAFKPVFQPIVDHIRGRLLGYEALTRFADGVAPDVHFADAAAVGLGVDLELATLESALAAAGALSRGPFLHFNVSPALVLERTQLRRLLGPTRSRIVLEITEHAAVGDYLDFRDAIDGLSRPVLLAVDDAGAGFASFRHILELRPAFIKLDVSLVRGIDADPAKQALVAGMRHFARKTNRRLIAEGVETEAEAAALRELDVRLCQGFLFGRPAPLPGRPDPKGSAR